MNLNNILLKYIPTNILNEFGVNLEKFEKFIYKIQSSHMKYSEFSIEIKSMYLNTFMKYETARI